MPSAEWPTWPAIPPALALVPEGRRVEFVERTLELLADRRRGDVLVERGRRRAEDFSLQSAVALNLDLYASVLTASKTGSRHPIEILALQEDGGSPDDT